MKYNTTKTLYSKAGKYGSFGDFGCGTPLITFKDMIKYIKEDIVPDVIFWTGDFNPHDLASHDYHEILKYQEVLTDTLVNDFQQFDV